MLVIMIFFMTMELKNDFLDYAATSINNRFDFTFFH